MTALSGLHVVCSRGGGTGKRGATVAGLRGILWSQTLASTGATTQVAPEANQEDGEPLFHLISAGPAWVAIGPDPDATSGNRMYLKAEEPVTIFCAPGDKVAYELASAFV